MTLRDAFTNMMDLSANDITHYDMEIDVTDRSEDGTFEDVKDYLSEKNLEFTEVCRTTTVYHYGDTESFVNVISGDDGIYPDYIEATDMKRKAEYSPAQDGILINNRISEDTGLESGTEFEIYDGEYHPQTVVAGEIYKNYYGSNLYLSEDDYESIVTIAAGLFLGVLAGFAMTDFLVRCVEYDNVMFIRDFDMLAWLFAIIVELFFALAINMISYRQLQKLKLTDISK